MGENDNDTYANINRVNYDFDDEAFTDISDEAKDFISKVLIKDKEYEEKYFKTKKYDNIYLVNVFLRDKPLLIHG